MHGLINRSIQCFLRDTYGSEMWLGVAKAVDLPVDGFEALLTYDDALTTDVLREACAVLAKPVEEVMEDLGTYLISHPNSVALRRLLRFGGATFSEFLHSLDDLQGRARLAVPDLELPLLDLREHSPGSFTLYSTYKHEGFGHVAVGILRAMADDYGTLVMLEYLCSKNQVAMISIDVHEVKFARGREFDLAAAT